jgi:putative oxygen-independent coproporphyrinogen III oxidase
MSTALHFLAPGQFHLAALPPLSLYIHYPWCVRKCPYCDFNSHEARHEHQESRYLDALRADLEAALPLIWGRRIHAIFIGGGTPSLLSGAGLDRLLADVRARLPLEPDAEITLEANPGTVEADRFSSFRASGVNRLSMGVQSFNDRHLQVLGRVHNSEEAKRALEMARRHFDNFNLDLMYALPSQTLQECESDLETALSFEPTHMSVYHLTLEPNTVFAKYPPTLPDDELSSDMQQAIETRLQQAGFQHYEVSAYARQDRQSRHNLNYWRFGDYLGIGAGAHSKISFPQRIIRQARIKQPESYMTQALAGQAVHEEKELSREDASFEFMLNALRLRQGVPSSLFHERTGLPLSVTQRGLSRAEEKGLIVADPAWIRPTELGRRFLNDLQMLFLPDARK